MLTRLCVLTVVSGCSSWYVMKPFLFCSTCVANSCSLHPSQEHPWNLKVPSSFQHSRYTFLNTLTLCTPCTAICSISSVSSTPWGKQASSLCKCIRMCWEKVLRKNKLSSNTVPGNLLIRYLSDIILLPSCSSPDNQQRYIHQAPYPTCTHNSCST